MLNVVRPYYEAAGITLFCGDCRDIIPSLLADDIDLILTDPPYGVGMRAFVDDFPAVEALNSAPGKIAAVFASPRRVVELATLLSPSWRFERVLWMHKQADIAAPWRGWCMNSEAICLFSRPGAKWPKPGDYRTDTYAVGPWERAGHPNGKPLAVVRDLLRRLSGGGIVLDPFAGSGTTLLAARDLGLRATGIEIEERFCRMTVDRLSQTVLPLGRTA